MVNQENEVMIRNLKENLEKTRDEKQELIDQIYKLQQENQVCLLARGIGGTSAFSASCTHRGGESKASLCLECFRVGGI